MDVGPGGDRRLAYVRAVQCLPKGLGHHALELAKGRQPFALECRNQGFVGELRAKHQLVQRRVAAGKVQVGEAAGAHSVEP